MSQMAKFLTTRGTTSQIENIINTAKTRLVLISPFIRIPETLFQCIKDADKRRVKITLVYGKSELNQDVRKLLEQLDNLSLYFHKNLHAKCFFNEDSMVITSMNLYDFSELNNREMGVLVNAEVDSDVFDEAIKEAQRIVKFSEPISFRKSSGKIYPFTKSQRTNRQSITATVKGYCIRCRISIPYDFFAPYCPACYKVWKKWEDPDYEEKYCHLCGKQTTTTIEYPLCRACYKNSQR